MTLQAIFANLVKEFLWTEAPADRVSRRIFVDSVVTFFVNQDSNVREEVHSLFSVMKVLHQIVASAIMLLLIGFTGAGCFASSAQMTVAEKACCQQMGGQCDMDMGAHSCCKKVQRHNEADLQESWRGTEAHLQSHLLVRESFSLDALNPPVVGSRHLFSKPPNNSPNSSITILRI